MRVCVLGYFSCAKKSKCCVCGLLERFYTTSELEI